MDFKEWCKGCVYNINDGEDGCNVYTERPYFCDNHINKSRKKEVDFSIKAYELCKSKYVPCSGYGGKYVTNV